MAASKSLTPAERALRGSIGGHTSWANTTDRTARTAPARAAADARFEKMVDPDGKLRPEVRARLAANARKAHYARMALASAKSRRRRATQA